MRVSNTVGRKMMDPLLHAVAKGWGWKIGKPVEILATNLFGNAIVKNDAGRFFRIMPEEWQCELLATSVSELEEKRRSSEFLHDWMMTRVVEMAERAHGPLADGQVYYWVRPGILGGKYDAENTRKISLRELLAYSGDMAQQIADVPDGEQIRIVVKETEL